VRTKSKFSKGALLRYAPHFKAFNGCFGHFAALDFLVLSVGFGSVTASDKRILSVGLFEYID
jgi:hypothetical protein